MLISLGWVVLAFVLGGTCGALGLAIFSTADEVHVHDTVEFASLNQTQ
jgi:hypothetical protein